MPVKTLRSFLIPVTLIAAMLGAFACGSSPAAPTNPTPPGPETRQLVAALQGRGLPAEVAEIMPQSSMPFFSVPAVRLVVDASSVHVFEYVLASVADAEATRASRDGSSVGVTQVLWVSDPHFFRGDWIIVLYVGTDDTVIEALTSLLGPQFAGR